jgi:heme A synthase
MTRRDKSDCIAAHDRRAITHANRITDPTTASVVVPPSAYHSGVLIHDRYGFVLTVVAALGALAAIVGLFRPRILPVVRLYVRVMIALVGVQVAIGLVLVATGDRPQQLIHWFYGAATLLTLPLAMLIGKRLGGREEQIWLAGGAVMTVLFALRALATG